MMCRLTVCLIHVQTTVPKIRKRAVKFLDLSEEPGSNKIYHNTWKLCILLHVHSVICIIYEKKRMSIDNANLFMRILLKKKRHTCISRSLLQKKYVYF